MLHPPPRSVTGVESTTSCRELPRSLDIEAPDGVWRALDVIHIPTPLPHPTDAALLNVNPLAANTLHPGYNTAGPPLVAIPAIPVAQEWLEHYCSQEQSEMALSLQAQLHLVNTKQSCNHKPRNSLTRNKSSYVSRVAFFDKFEERFGQGNSKDTDAGATGIAVGRGFTLLERAPKSATRGDPLARILFTQAWPIKCALNRATRASGLVDVALGMSSGDIIWCELTSQRYSRLNKAGAVTNAAVTTLTWVPGSSRLVAVGHADGRIVIYDVEKDDVPPITAAQLSNTANSSFAASNSVETITKLHSLYEPHLNGIQAAYEISQAAVTAIAFSSPKLAALASRDGYIRLFDLESETVTDIFPSLFAGILCASFSPDGKYLAFGGEDDLVTILCMEEKKTVARLAGHRSWVRRVLWDFHSCDCAASEYRLITAAEDGQVLFYDFLPKTLPTAQLSKTAKPQKRNVGATTIHAVTPLGPCPRLRPLAHVQPATDGAEPLPLCDIVLGQSFLQVSSSDGRIWTWARPEEIRRGSIV